MKLDHVAIADRDVLPLMNHLVGALGATVLHGGLTVGFRPVQVRVGDGSTGMTVELLEPWRIEENDFLERFLVRNGSGPHHLTYKVTDIEETIREVEAAGYKPVVVNIDNHVWREVFLDPRQTHGTVIQFAEDHVNHPDAAVAFDAARAGISSDAWTPKWWPDPVERAPEAAVVRAVVLGTPALDDAVGFYEGLLAGERDGEGDGWVELRWAKGAGLRLVERPGRAGIEWIDIRASDPATHGETVVSGTRLIVRDPQDPAVR